MEEHLPCGGVYIRRESTKAPTSTPTGGDMIYIEPVVQKNKYVERKTLVKKQKSDGDLFKPVTVATMPVKKVSLVRPRPYTVRPPTPRPVSARVKPVSRVGHTSQNRSESLNQSAQGVGSAGDLVAQNTQPPTASLITFSDEDQEDVLIAECEATEKTLVSKQL